MATSQETATELRQHLESGIAKASRSKQYRLVDGTMVQRQSLTELIDAHDRVSATEAVASRGGMFTAVAYNGDEA